MTSEQLEAERLYDGPIGEELNHTQTPFGPSSKGICRVINGNTCGSGSLVGVRNGKSLVMTNAHVAGSRVGKAMQCEFPELGRRVGGRVIIAAYSNRVMMDWAVLEMDEHLASLPHMKMSKDAPSGEHYTGGYPRCRGPYYQKLRTQQITHGGTVWRWQPNAIGGQSGSGVHSLADNLQYGVLTWTLGGDGAGQTCKSIWFQYVNRDLGLEVGIARPDGLVELCVPAEDLEPGIFQEANITTLPIWDHLDDDDDEGDGDTPPPPNPDFAKKVLADAEKRAKEAQDMAEYARQFLAPEARPDGSDDGCQSGGGLFGF